MILTSRPNSAIPSVRLAITILSKQLLLCCLLACWSCSGDQSSTPSAPNVMKAQLASGTYKVTSAANFPTQDEQQLYAITANLDRASNKLVLTLQDGSTRNLSFVPRGESQWQQDCAVMGGYALDEVADLNPVPLQLDSVNFSTPLVYAKCSSTRMILTTQLGAKADSSTPALIFDATN